MKWEALQVHFSFELKRQTFRADESDEEFFEKKKIPKKKEFSNEEFFIGKK